MERVHITRAGFSTHVAEGDDVRTNFWLVFFDRKHNDRNYIRVCKTLKNHHNNDVVAIGKLLYSLPAHRGYKLVEDLISMLPHKL